MENDKCTDCIYFFSDGLGSEHNDQQIQGITEILIPTKHDLDV